MKNRKTIIVAFLLVAALCLGIGYAALTDQLNITGTASINTAEAQEVFDADVYFSDAKLAADQTDVAADDYSITRVSVGDDDSLEKPDGVQIDVNKGLAVIGDKMSFTLTIKNEGGRNVAVALKTNIDTVAGEKPSASTNGYFNAYIVGDQAYTVPAGGTVDVTVCVELLKTVDASITDAAFGIYMTATSAG